MGSPAHLPTEIILFGTIPPHDSRETDRTTEGRNAGPRHRESMADFTPPVAKPKCTAGTPGIRQFPVDESEAPLIFEACCTFCPQVRCNGTIQWSACDDTMHNHENLA